MDTTDLHAICAELASLLVEMTEAVEAMGAALAAEDSPPAAPETPQAPAEGADGGLVRNGGCDGLEGHTAAYSVVGIDYGSGAEVARYPAKSKEDAEARAAELKDGPLGSSNSWRAVCEPSPPTVAQEEGPWEVWFRPGDLVLCENGEQEDRKRTGGNGCIRRLFSEKWLAERAGAKAVRAGQVWFTVDPGGPWNVWGDWNGWDAQWAVNPEQPGTTRFDSPWMFGTRAEAEALAAKWTEEQAGYDERHRFAWRVVEVAP